MRQRTFTCRDCGITVTVMVKPGRPAVLCAACLDAIYRRRLDKVKADRAAVRVAHETCLREGCSNPLPAGARADAKWCSRACQSWNNRRATGQVVENSGSCSSCLQPLVGRQANATVCLSRKCLSWAARHPGVPHPSTQPRACKHCSASIDHLNGKTKFCSKKCASAWRYEQDPDGHKAKSRAWQSTEQGKTYARTYQQANAPRRQQWARADRQKKPEQYARYWKQFAEANPDVLKDASHTRRARQYGNRDSIGVPAWEWRKILNRFQGCCAYCGVKPDVIHMDHVVPLSKGGRHAAPNCLPACAKCNQSKHAMFLSVWRYRGRRLLLSA